MESNKKQNFALWVSFRTQDSWGAHREKKPTGCEDTKEMINCETGLLTYTTHKINQNKSKI